MYTDVECPYCGEGQVINHDDGYGYEEGVTFQQHCYDCDKDFAFTTSISFDYDAQKAPCMNGGEHEFKQVHTAPRKYTKMRCEYCDEEREPTEEEWKIINK